MKHFTLSFLISCFSFIQNYASTPIARNFSKPSIEDSSSQKSANGIIHVQFTGKPVFNSVLKTKTRDLGRLQYLVFSADSEVEGIFFNEIAQKKEASFFTASDWVMVRRYLSAFEFQDFLAHKGDSLLIDFDQSKPITVKYSNFNYTPLDFTVEKHLNQKETEAYLITGKSDDIRMVAMKYFYDDPQIIKTHSTRTAREKVIYIETLENQMATDLITPMNLINNKAQEFLDSLNRHRLISKEVYAFYQDKYANLLFKIQLMSGKMDSLSSAKKLNEKFTKTHFNDYYLNACVQNYERRYFASKAKWETVNQFNFRDSRESFRLVMNSSLLSHEVKEQMLFLGLSNVDYFFRTEINKHLHLFTAFAKNKSLIEKAQEKYQEDIIANNKSSNLHLESLTKQQTSIEDILRSKKGKILFIDFWASWCGPCIEEMKYSKQLSQTYKDRNLEVVFFSTDDSFQKWAKASERLALDQYANNFKILNFGNSKFNQQHKFKSIPRYMIVGKDGQIINNNAPRPSDPRLQTVLDKLLQQ
ncbi:TlpA family protein disulfide reductase [Flectobacillus roseus]|uniref:TlpA family protein disulfide reductase n=1 Tax=Flectobacillus roseus TaxID=502259 RepID=UPI0024B8533D|nr:TlpA disulfide reductase family protein [Flectobacillus roseus]MDI9871002.1 TlpA disulfide reductase family protein [Flectobacillus roseus]